MEVEEERVRRSMAKHEGVKKELKEREKALSKMKQDLDVRDVCVCVLEYLCVSYRNIYIYLIIIIIIISPIGA